MGNAGNVGHTPQDFGNIGFWLEGHQEASGNASHLPAAAIREGCPKVLAQPFLEKVPVAFLEPKFVIVNHEKSIHRQHYNGLFAAWGAVATRLCYSKRCRIRTSRRALA